MTSQLLQLLTALSAFSLEMLYATYTLVVCLLLCEVSKNLQKNFEISWNFLRTVFLLYELTIFNQGFLLPGRILKVFTTHCFNHSC